MTCALEEEENVEMPDDALLSADQAARYAGCSAVKIYAAGFHRELPTVEGPDGRSRIPFGALKRYKQRIDAEAQYKRAVREAAELRDRLKRQGGLP
jgi:hypothetical protein